MKFGCFKMSKFFKTTNFQHFFTKISGNSQRVSRMNSCIGQGCSSTYQVVRLINKCVFRVFCTKMTFGWTAWQPDNQIGWATSLAYPWVHSTHQRTIFWNFGEKMLKICGFWKIDFFKQPKFDIQNLKNFSTFIPV